MRGQYIQLFDTQHLLYIAMFICTLVLFVLYKQRIRAHRHLVGKILIVASVVQQVLIHGYHLWSTGYSADVSLPLHICRLATLLGLWYLFTKHNAVLQIAFYFGLFALGSFAYPSRIMPVYHPLGLSFVISHILIIIIPWFAVIADDWRPSLPGMHLAMVCFTGYFAFVYLLNPLIGGNYFYLVQRPFLHNLPEMIYVPLCYVTTLLIFRFGYWLFGQRVFRLLAA